MEKSRRFLLLSLSMVLLLVFISGCSSKSSEMDMSPPMESQDSPAGDSGAFEQEKGESSLEPEKVITTIHMSFETIDFSATQKSLESIIKKHDSYVENSNVRYNSYYNSKNYRHADYVIRVPKDKVASFKEDLNGVGLIKYESTEKTDVTKQYNDTKSRLNILETKEERLLHLLEKAEKIEDIIALENQLNEVVYEKERLKSTLLSLDDKVAFSTIYLDIEEVERLSNMETMETGFGTKIKNALSDSLYNFKIIMENFIVFLIYFFPFGIIIIVLGFIGFKLFKKIRSKRQDKKDKTKEIKEK